MFINSDWANIPPGMVPPFFPPGVVPRSRRKRLANLVVGLLAPLIEWEPPEPAPAPVESHQQDSATHTESGPTHADSPESPLEETITVIRSHYEALKRGLHAVFERFPDARQLFFSFDPNASPPVPA
jgi:hypothetical protein